MYSLAAILGLFAAGCTAAPAEAGVVTSDTPAWSNEGVTLELGASQRSLERKGTRTESRVREIAVPAVVDHEGNIITPANTRHETFTVVVPTSQRSSSTAVGATALVKPFGSDFLVGLGYDQAVNGSLFGQASVRNGRLVGTVSSTTSGKLGGTVALTVLPKLAGFVDFRNGGTSYGAQYQAGDVSLFGAYSPANKGYSFGVALSIGSQPKQQEPEHAPDFIKGRG